MYHPFLEPAQMSMPQAPDPKHNPHPDTSVSGNKDGKLH